VLRKRYTEILTSQLWSLVFTDTWHLCIIVRKLPLMMELWTHFSWCWLPLLTLTVTGSTLMSCMCTQVHWGIPQDGGKATCVHVHMYVQLKVGASQLSLEKEFSDISWSSGKNFADVSTECFCHHQGEWEEVRKHQHYSWGYSLDVIRGQRSVTIASPNLSPHQCGPAQNLQPLFHSYNISSAAASRKSCCPCIVVSEVWCLIT